MSSAPSDAAPGTGAATELRPELGHGLDCDTELSRPAIVCEACWSSACARGITPCDECHTAKLIVLGGIADRPGPRAAGSRITWVPAARALPDHGREFAVALRRSSTVIHKARPLPELTTGQEALRQAMQRSALDERVDRFFAERRRSRREAAIVAMLATMMIVIAMAITLFVAFGGVDR